MTETHCHSIFYFRNKMNILFLNYEFPPLGGGAGNATYYLLKEFSHYENLHIDLVTSSVDKYKEGNFSHNIKIYYLDIHKEGNLHFQSNFDLLKYSWQAHRLCKKLRKYKKYDLVHAFFGIPCGYIAMKLKIPYIVSLRGSDVPFYNERFYLLDKFIFKRLSKKIWKRTKKVIANSEGLKKLANKVVPDQEISVIYNGVDTEEFRPLEDKQEENKLKIISIGRLIERKGFKYLFESIKNNKQVSLTLVGEGNLQSELKKLAARNNIEVNFLGKINHKDIAKYLQRADLFVLPSLNEGMSNSILEAMACGLPIIATDTGGSKELIKNNGFVVKKADAGSLKKVIENFIANRELIESMGRASREAAEKMSWDNIARDYLKVYKY